MKILIHTTDLEEFFKGLNTGEEFLISPEIKKTDVIQAAKKYGISIKSTSLSSSRHPLLMIVISVIPFQKAFDEYLKGQKIKSSEYVHGTDPRKGEGTVLTFENGYKLVIYGGCSSGSNFMQAVIIDKNGAPISDESRLEGEILY